VQGGRGPLRVVNRPRRHPRLTAPGATALASAAPIVDHDRHAGASGFGRARTARFGFVSSNNPPQTLLEQMRIAREAKASFASAWSGAVAAALIGSEDPSGWLSAFSETRSSWAAAFARVPPQTRIDTAVAVIGSDPDRTVSTEKPKGICARERCDEPIPASRLARGAK
jgi:hypothetical protein